MSKTETLAKLRRDIADVVAEPFDPVAAFYADAPPLPPQPPLPPRLVDTGGYPIEDIDRFLREEAEYLQAISGEDPQC